MQNKSMDELVSQAEKLVASGDIRAAIIFLKNVITQHPHFYEAWLLLSKCLYDTAYYKEAIAVAQNAERIDPLQDDFRAIQTNMQNHALGHALGNALDNALDNAQRMAKDMLVKQPGHPRAIFTLAHIATQKNQDDKAIALLNKGLELSPANLTLRQMRIHNLMALGEYKNALEEAELLIRIEPSFDSLWLYMQLLLKLGQYNTLLSISERAQSMCSADKQKLSRVMLLRGQTFRILGQRKQAIDAFNSSILYNLNNAEVWWALADMKDYEFSGSDRTAMQAVLHAKHVQDSAKCSAAFALAKASEAEQNWDATMNLYHQANKQYKASKFDIKEVQAEFHARMKAFTKHTLTLTSAITKQSFTPIFIVGLPRSGSTLVEQILASHSHIESTIEQPTLAAIERRANAICRDRFNTDLYTGIGLLSALELQQLGEQYLRSAEVFRKTNKPYFIDKLPFNFRHIGLIHKILPHALIIDVRRNPMDCGFSLYRQYFPNGVDFCYDLRHIGQFYQAYTRLMKHWHECLPNKVLHVQYEGLVDRPEQVVTTILAHIGLEFEEACIYFYQSNRAVHTASSEQVRQAINKKGIDSWRKVEAHLKPLKDSLGEEVLANNATY